MNPDALVAAHMAWAAGMARAIARKVPRSFDIDDLIAAAHLGLWKAASKYESGRGVTFLQFAHTYVQGEIWMSVRRKNYTEATHASIPLSAATPEVATMAVQLAQLGTILRDGLSRLDPTTAAVVRRRLLEDEPMANIAADVFEGSSQANKLRKAYAMYRDGLRLLRSHCEARGVSTKDLGGN